MHSLPLTRSLSDNCTFDVSGLCGSISLPLTLGVCAMQKKVLSTPMKEILKHFNPEEIKIIIFPEETILRMKPASWPIVDVFISFYSAGFPLAKAQKYVKIRKPMVINDVYKQELLWDRSLIIRELRKEGIVTPVHYFVHRDCTEDLITKYKYNLSINESNHIVDKHKTIHHLPLVPHIEKQSSPMPYFSHLKLNIHNHATHADKLTKSFGDISQSSPQPDLNHEISHIKVEGLEEQSVKEPSDQNPKTRTVSFSLLNEEIIFTPLLRNKNKLKSSEEYVIEEFDDHIFINNVKVNKPFVEKPFDAENHDINIYYPFNDGGGCKKLFRKIGDVSSKFDSSFNEIRRDGNYIYEEFLPTDGFDIKVYTVGPDYAHAEARKSPVLDGKVQRTVTGKEVRYPVTLTPEEKIIAKKICKCFGQNVCGFDLLRSNGVSYVCDVNGWSFVKGNVNYYRDCALMLRHMILLKFAPNKLNSMSIRSIQLNSQDDNSEMESHMISSIFRPEITEKTIYSKEELRSVVAVFRHGDRTPKQKMKMKIKDPRFLELFDSEPDKTKELVIKKAVLLQKILDVTRIVLDELNHENQFDSDEDHDTNISKLYQLISVLEKGGHFEEINRKIQIKPLKIINYKNENGQNVEKVTEGLFVMKWGGELTHSGEDQARLLGQLFQQYMYPNENEGILRLHSTYRHDLKIYSSDEGRCLKTAGSFCKGFLNLEGELTPIMVSMVRKDELAQDLLDLRNRNIDLCDIMKILSKILNKEGFLEESLKQLINLDNLTNNELEIIRNIGEPLKLMRNLLLNISKLTKILRSHLNLKNKTYYINPHDMKMDTIGMNSEDEGQKTLNKPVMVVCGQENLILVFKRWRKLEIDFYDMKKEIFNISKIPDIHDSIKYDMIHNFKYFGSLSDEVAFHIYDYSEKIVKFLTPNEFGLTKEKKCEIGISIIDTLFKKIKSDLIWWNTSVGQSKEAYREDGDYWMIRNLIKGTDHKDHTPMIKSKWRHVRTRLYFTSASHLYSMFNVIKFGSNGILNLNKEEINKVDFLNYLSHFVFRLFENLGADPNDPNRFRLELHVCPGNMQIAFDNLKKTHEDNKNHKTQIAPLVLINQHLSLGQLEEFFKLLYKTN